MSNRGDQMADPSQRQATPDPLPPEEAALLTEWARAFKAAARAILLYPPEHPALAVTLARVVDVTSPIRLPRPLTIAVLPDSLLVDSRAPSRAHPAIAELAALLHSHLIGEITIHGGGDVDAWRRFLSLVSRTPEALRADGGITRAWTTMAGRHVEVREIDYADLLRERDGGRAARWPHVIASCLDGSRALDEAASLELAGLAASPESLNELMKEIERRAGATGGTVAVRTAAILRLLRGIVETVTKTDPDRIEGVLRNMAGAIAHLSADTLLGLLARRSEAGEEPGIVQAVVSRMSDGSIAQFVARNVIESATATDRLAEAFQVLVKDPEDRVRLIALAERDVAESPLGNADRFQEVWSEVAQKLLTSYSDTSYVSEDYGRELSGARTRAIDVDQAGGDPPERIAAWLATVGTTALRELDLTLVLDLLRIEDDDQRWGELVTPVVALVEDLLLVGDFDAAGQLADALVREAGGTGSKTRRQYAVTGIDMLVSGPMMRHIVTHLSTIDEAQFERVKALSVSLGEVVVKPLAEALSGEERGRVRQRLTAILLAFGVVGRRTAERLKGSPNPAVRRTAIYLLREFGGTEALSDLTELLNDPEPQVQREAVRALVNLGTDPAYQVLERALAGGSPELRDVIVQSAASVRDERATPLFVRIVQHTDHRGPLADIYLRAIESLGSLRDPGAIPALTEALYRGEWWAPRRSAACRSAAAAALARIGTPGARTVLEDAATGGPRGVRAAVRPHLDAMRKGAHTSRGAAS